MVVIFASYRKRKGKHFLCREEREKKEMAMSDVTLAM